MRWRSFDVTRVERPCAVPSLEGRLGWVLISKLITLSFSPSFRERDAQALNCRARSGKSITAVYKLSSYSAYLYPYGVTNFERKGTGSPIPAPYIKNE